MSNDVTPNFNEETTSTNNSSTVNIGAGASFTGLADNVINFEILTITFFADQPCTIQLEQSPDGSNWDIVDSYTTQASVGDARSFDSESNFLRLIVTNNGSSPTTALRLQTIYSPSGTTTPRALTQLGNFRVAVEESVPIGVSGTTAVSGGVSVLNFPTTQGVSGSVSILNFPADQLIHGVVGVSGTTAVSGSVSVLNFPQTQEVSGTVTVLEGTSPWGVSGNVSILNFPAIQGVSGTVTDLQGTVPWVTRDQADGVSGQASPQYTIQVGGSDVSGILRTLHTDVSGNLFANILNYPSTQGVSGSVSILNFPADQLIHGVVGVSGTTAVSGSVSILNFPVIQGVSGTVTVLEGTNPWGVSGTLGVSGTTTVSGSVSILNFPATQGVSGTVTVLEGTNPWGVSGTVTNLQGTVPWVTRDQADGVSGQVSPTYTMQVGGADSVSGNLRTLHTDVSGNLYTNTLDGFGNKISSASNGNAGNQLLHTQTPDTTVANATLSAVSGTNSNTQVAMVGLQSAGFQLNAGTFAGTITPQGSVDGGNTWTNTQFYNPTTQSTSTSLSFASANTLTILGIVGFPGVSHLRAQVTSYVSGSAVAIMRAASVAGSAPSTTISAAFGTVTNTTVTMPGNTATLLVAANSNRKYLLIANNSGSKMQMQFTNTPAITGTTGLQIPAGGFYEFKGDNLFTGSVYGFAAGGITVFITEGTP